MSADRVLDRLRAANPASTAVITNDELFARITASPGDPRLVASEPRGLPRRRSWRTGGHPFLLLAAMATLAACGAVGAIKFGGNLGAFSHDSPIALFKANPAALFPNTSHQVVIPRTVHRVATATVPGVGKFEYWIALSTKGWLCEAIRLPDRTWAATSDGHDKLDPGGAAPACGGVPWPLDGYSYMQLSIPAPHGRWWRIEYGFGPTQGKPVKVRDTFSGATAPIADGRYFAIVLPLCHGRVGEHEDKCQSRPVFHYFRLETLSASGSVLSKAQRDPGM
jgi:hypothetical protein